MYKSTFLALFAIALAPLSFSHPAHVETASDGPTVLRPINVRQYEAATGLRRREDENFADLDPKTQSQLIYGSSGDNGQILLANMTLYAPDGLPIVLMERFEGLTSKVDCKGDDGAMSLVFKSKAAYDYALKVWQYINEKDDEQFLLIANHDGCGPDDERQPYKVSKVVDDASNLAIDMTTTVASWSEVGGTYDIDFGQAIPYKKPTMRSRSFLGDVVNVGKDVLNAAQGNFDVPLQTMTFDTNVGNPGTKSQIYKSEGGVFEIDCVDCYVTGSWSVQGHIKVDHFTLDDLTLSAGPSNFKAMLKLEATISAEKDPESLNPDPIELVKLPIPGAGIAVKGIFSIGLTVAYDVGTSATFSGTATADFGLEATLPDGARVTADISNPDQSSATGWAGSGLDPIFEVTKLEADIELAAYSQPKVEFGITLDNVGDVGVTVGMKLPEISSTLSAVYDPQGVCSQTAGASKTGVKLENKADISVSLSIEANLGDEDNKPKWSQTLFDWSKDLPAGCIPLPIPGLAEVSGGDASKSSNGSTAPTATSSSGGATGQACTPPGKTGICQSTDTPCDGGSYISGYCPGSTNIQCCPSSTTCAPPGKTGICRSTSSPCPGGAYIPGYCPGSTNVQCCPQDTDTTTTSSDDPPAAKAKANTKPTTTTAKTTTTTTCSPPGKTGLCQSTSTPCDGGSYVAGYCPGDESIECCATSTTITTNATPTPSPSPSGGGGGGGCKRDVVVGVGVGGVERRMLVAC